MLMAVLATRLQRIAEPNLFGLRLTHSAMSLKNDLSLFSVLFHRGRNE